MPEPPSYAARDAVAIVGMHGRFPGAPDLDAFWRNLRDGVESLTRLSDDQLRAAGVDEETLADPDFVRVGRLLEDVDAFDARFFGYSARDAALLDPQQRLFLEGAWAALEDAGHPSGAGAEAVAVYAGLGQNTYLLSQIVPSAGPWLALDDLVAQLASEKDFLATRVSYHLDLTGPSVVVQSGCSSSLVAVAHARDALLRGECDLALAGGVSVRVPQERGYTYVREGILSPDGHCRPFDKDARGTSFGSGVGVVVLKRLDAALADGDPVRAVLRGAAINNDGGAKLGYTAPNPERQAAVIRRAQERAGVDPATIGYVEAHGTGTALGDPLEFSALQRAFGAHGGDGPRHAVGSVKGNIGHLDAASGVAGLIKTVLALEHGRIPPTLYFREPNPRLKLDGSALFVNDSLRAWDANGAPRRAGVSSFGIGGTNVHVVVEEAPEREASSASREVQVLVLSAKTDAALGRASARLADHLEAHPELPLADVASTLQRGRAAFARRRAVVCRDRDEAIARLRGTTTDTRNPVEGTRDASRRAVAFAFPGQGSEYVGMARGLHASEPAFREQIDRVCALFRPHLPFDLHALLFGDAPGGEVEARLRETAFVQPALFAIEYALAQLWMRWGVRPDALIGHSLGELVAATVAGVFDLEGACRVVAERGRLVQALPRGAMLAVFAPEETVLPLLVDGVALSAVSSGRSCTVSGSPEAISAQEERIREAGHKAYPLDLDRAFHSPLVEAAMEPLAAVVAEVGTRPPSIAVVSNVSGTWLTDGEACDPRSWARQLRSTVRFRDGVATLAADPSRVVLEVGPGRTLHDFVNQEMRETGDRPAIPSLPRHPRDRDDSVHLSIALAELWVRGVEIDWDAYYADEQRRTVSLPTYAFERTRYWIGAPGAAPASTNGASATSEPDPVGAWLWAPRWIEGPDGPATRAADPNARWLVFTDHDGPGDALGHALLGHGSSVILVRPGAEFERTCPVSFRIDPRDPAHVERLLDELGDGERPDRVVHAWLATRGELDDAAALERGFWSIDRVARALDARGGGREVELAVVTRGTSDAGERAVDPARAAALGAVRVLPQEQPALRVRAIDVELPGSPTEGDLQPLVAELLGAGTDERVALGAGRRWVRHLERVDAAASSGRPALRKGGTYWITGGLGGVGRALARHLAADRDAKLVLTSRNALPPRGDWVLQEQFNDCERRGIAFVRELEALGAEVVVREADASDPVAMAALARELRERFGAIHGIVHAAGVSAAPVDAAPGEWGRGRELPPKLGGLRSIEAVLGDDVELVVLCSAVATELGGLGQGAYCAANAALDAWAVANQAGARRVVSIGFDTWGESGMAVEATVPDALRARHRELLDAGLTDAEGIAVFRRALETPLPHVLVSKAPLDARLAEALAPVRPEPAPAAATADGVQTESAIIPQAFNDDSELPARIDEVVTQMWGQLLGRGAPRPDDHFFDLGGNSLLATQMLARLRKHFLDADISLRRFFDEPSLAGLIDAVRETFGLAPVAGERVAATAAPTPSAAPAPGPSESAPTGDGVQTESAIIPQAFNDDADLPTRIDEVVTQMWGQLLGRDAPRPDDHFFDLGGNSLLATQMLARLRKHFLEADISLRRFFDEPTLAGLIDAVRETFELPPVAQQTAAAAPTPPPTPSAPSTAEPAAPAAGVQTAAAIIPEQRTRSEVAEVTTAMWAQMLGEADPGPDSHFFDRGGNSLLATQMLARLRKHFLDTEISLRAFFDDPTLAGLIRTIEAAIPDDGSEPTTAEAPDVGDEPEPELDELRALLADELAGAFDASPAALLAGGSLSAFDETLLATHLTGALQERLGLAFYPHEIRGHETLDSLARAIASEHRRLAGADASGDMHAQAERAIDAIQAPARARLHEGPKLPTAAFVLSAPRSGSTLLRVMLSAHPRLFCPPELFLLDNAGMRTWSEDPFGEFYRDGVVRAFMAREGLEYDAASARVDELVARDASVAEVYRALQGTGDELLVDKTPTYALSPATLRRAEEMFEEPRYVFLVRHPIASIESIVRNRLDRVRRVDGDSHAVAETYWTRTYENLAAHRERVGEARCHVVRYEDVVRAPEPTLRALLAFLGVPFDDAVLDPYGKGRMIAGPGDPHLFERGAIDPALAEAWRDVRLPRPVRAKCAALARSFDYELPGDIL